MSNLERRRFPRAAIKIPVTVLVDRRPMPGALLDISKGGLLFSCLAPIQVSDEVEVDLTVTPDLLCSGTGQVVLAADERGFGVKFSNTNRAMHEFVTDLVSLRSELHSDFLTRVLNPTVVVRGSLPS